MLMRSQGVLQAVDARLFSCIECLEVLLNKFFKTRIAIVQEPASSFVAPLLTGLWIGVQDLACLGNMFQHMKDVQHTFGITKMLALLFPDRSGTIGQDSDGGRVSQAPSLPSGFLASSKVLALFNR